MPLFSYASFLPNLIDQQLKNIHNRQAGILLAQFLLMIFALGLLMTAVGTTMFTYVASLILTQETLMTALIVGVTGLIGLFAVLDLKPIYIDKLKDIDSGAIAPDKIAFIKREVAELSKKAGVASPDVYFNKSHLDINASYGYGLFKNGKIIFTAGFLRSFGLGGLSERDVRATIAHELGHKISKDLFYILLQTACLILTACMLISAVLDLALLWWATPLALATTLPPVLLVMGLFLLIPSSFALQLKYRENMEIAADIKGVELTNDVEGMSNKGISLQNNKLAGIRMLSFLDHKQVGLYLQSLKSLRIPQTVEKLKALLLENIPYRKKRKKLINSSFLDDHWTRKLATPTIRFLSKHRHSINTRSKQESANQGLLTRFNNFVQTRMNPYPSDEVRMSELRRNFPVI